MWSESVRGTKDKAKLAIVAANNHYAGFSCNCKLFYKDGQIEEAAWDELKQKNIVTSVYFSRIESKANFAIWHAPISQDVL